MLALLAILAVGGPGPCGPEVLSAAAPDVEQGEDNGNENAEANAHAEDFFESRIRPVLVEHCYACHSSEAETLEGGLRLDTRQGVLAGGDGGPILQPEQDKPARLLRALRHQELQMPPDGPLPDAVIADFARWLHAGAAMPADYGRASSEADAERRIDYEAARRHWAFQPIERPELPGVVHRDWCREPIDYYVLEMLERNGLQPSPEADPRSLVRRLYFDLTGLPPSFEEVESLARHTNPVARDRAYAQLVDRLLASPAYGERWGRHWLDVARYADTKDQVLVFGDDRIRPYAYTYRDYVIRSLNDDLPYDEFIRHQLAADQIQDAPADARAAMGFLTLGRLFDDNLPDVYDDQIDTVTRGLLGLTVACARCHDHKYDAIPIDDYYSLYGMFANSEAPVPLPLVRPDEVTTEQAEILSQIEAKASELHVHLAQQYEHLTAAARDRVADYLVRVTEPPDPLETAVFYLSLSPDDLRPQIVASWRQHIQRRATSDDPVWGMWFELITSTNSGTPATNGEKPPESTENQSTTNDAIDDYANKAREILARWAERPAGVEAGQVNPVLLAALVEAAPRSRADVARVYGAQFLQALNTAGSTDGAVAGSPTGPATSAAVQQLAEELRGAQSPVYFPRRHTYTYMARVEREKFGSLLQAIDRLAVQSPLAPPRAMMLVDSPEPEPARVLLRGNPRTPGHVVAAGFLSVLSRGNAKFSGPGSGRRELAEAITADDNPLTSRVMANRVWMHHFAAPLVATPSDFGARSDPPSHPKLLDYLAWSLKHHDWSIKHLHREIVMSAVYRQSSGDRADARELDPANRWLWRAHPRRLELEPMRDAMLSVAGLLDRSMYGRPSGVIDRPDNRRRSLYGLVDRQELPGIYRVFDFASPDQSADQRPRTITPQQALFAMNSPLVVGCSQALADASRGVAAEVRAEWMFRRILSRDPTDAERERVARYVESARDAASGAAGGAEKSSAAAAEAVAVAVEGAWRDVAQSLLVSNEFMFLD